MSTAVCDDAGVAELGDVFVPRVPAAAAAAVARAYERVCTEHQVICYDRRGRACTCVAARGANALRSTVSDASKGQGAMGFVVRVARSHRV
jgi:hypothetical protein